MNSNEPEKCKTCGANISRLGDCEDYECVNIEWKKKVNLEYALNVSHSVPARYAAAKDTDAGSLDLSFGKEGLFLTGPAGVGKTHIAYIAGGRWMVHNKERSIFKTLRSDFRDEQFCKMFLCITVPELLVKIRATFNDSKATEETVVKKYATAPLLLLDDLGAEKVTDFSMQTVYVILNRRLDCLLPTIITSNLSLTEINEYDSRLASRVGALRKLTLKGKDRRLGESK